MKTLNDGPCCPFKTAQALISGKYKQQILWVLMERSLRFSELRQYLSGITPKVLTQQLRELEEDGLLTRTVYPMVPPKVEYTLTELGKSTKPILISVRDWGKQYLEARDQASACHLCGESPD